MVDNNEEFDFQKTMQESLLESRKIVEVIIEEYDTFDILLKLISLNQLNIHKEIISGLGFSFIEKYILRYRFTFNNRKTKRISEEKLLLFVNEFIGVSFKDIFAERNYKDANENFEYDSYVDFNRDVKGDAFPHQVYNQNYQIMHSIRESYEYHTNQNVDAFFKFNVIMQRIYIDKFIEYYDENDIDKIEEKEVLVRDVFKYKLYDDILINEEDILNYKLEGEDLLTIDELKYYLSLYSCDITDELYKEYSDIEKYPIFKKDSDLLVISHHYFTWNQTDKVNEIMRSKPKLFKKHNAARGRWLEETTYVHLLKVFEEKYLFRNPYYYVDGELCESDILIDYHDTLIVIECKSAHMKLASKIGSVSRFKKDVEKILEDSYTQSDRLRKSIASTLKTDDFLMFKKDGKSVIHNIKMGSPDRIIMINVSLDNLKALSTMLNRFHKEGIYRKGLDIVSYNIHDFEYITEFLTKPYQFIDYTIKRIERVQKYHVVDELDYLGWYHETLLNLDFDMDYASIYMAEDYIPYFEKYIHGLENKLELKINKDWLEIVNMISNREYPRKLCLELGLLNMKEEGLPRLINQLNEFAKDSDILIGKTAKTFTIIPEDDINPNMVITFVYVSEHKYSEYIFNRVISKVKQRFQKSNKLHWFTVVFHSEDIKVKQVIYESSGVFVKVRRNEPCPCGSGLKYKKCCIK